MRRILLALLAILFLQCVPEDGIDGLNGQNGIDGTNGQDGSDGISIGLESNALGNGCRELIFFKDSNNNGVKDSSESVVSSFEICDGTTPNIKLITEESESCANGGTVFIFFDDINDDGVIDSNESILGTETICNGLDGQNGTSVSLFIEEASLNDCPSGGLLITVFIDTDGDGEYDADTESIVTQTIACYPERLLNIPTDGLLAYYPFSGNANDASGNGKNGQVNGATLTTDRFGNANSAYNFESTQNIIIPETESYGNVFPLTISLWYNVSELKEESGNIFSKYTAASWNGYQILFGKFGPEPVSPDYNGFGVTPWYVNGTNNTIISGYGNPTFMQEPIGQGVWYHYVFVVDETGGKIYVNGELIDSQEWSGVPSIVSSSYLWKIGGNYEYNAFPDHGFYGKIDDISIWEKALTSDEVRSLFYNY